jgi:O-acetyl-ADP-ribose deacetylase (regulator of RNase III)
MLTFRRGNILKAEAEALVNTVNCVGVMGKGIALQFKKSYPENFKAYKKACDRKEITPGKVFVFTLSEHLFSPKYIINFPTKNHWKESSKMWYIRDGLENLVQVVQELGIRSIAVPPLGCGLGGLDWGQVKVLIEKAFAKIPHVDVLVFEPAGTPNPEDMPINTARPKLTVAKALLLLAMHQYSREDYELSLLEAQKLGYFLEEAGAKMGLAFSAGPYGPYAENLSHMLHDMDGHYIEGCGDDNNPGREITLLPEAINEAKKVLRENPEKSKVLGKVSGIIRGFETPHGMELLSSVHWVSFSHANLLEQEEISSPAQTEEEAYRKVCAWNQRKAKIFTPHQVRCAFRHLSAVARPTTPPTSA